MSENPKVALVSEVEVQEFRRATLTQTNDFPLTFWTKFRLQEFNLLRGLNVDFHELLHLEQTYHYFEPVKVGDSLEVTSCIADNKVKKGMQLITIETTLSSGGIRKVVSESKMVVRLKEGSER